jgi:acyl-CoA synthetase (AMP-forming)/AMP-acid ligase II
MSLADAVRRSLSSHPDRTAVRIGAEAISRDELWRAVERRARLFADSAASLLPLDGAEPAAFVTDVIAARLAGKSALVHPPGTPPRLRRLREDAIEGLVAADRIVFYSSGSIGTGKAVALSDEHILFAALAYAGEILRPEDRVALGVPAAHVYGFIRGVLNTLLTGAEVIVLSPGRDPLFDAQAAGATIVLLSARQLLLAARSQTAVSLKAALTGGAPVPDSAARSVEGQRGVPLRVGYGLTESAGLATRQSFGRPRRPGTSGQPAKGMRVDVVGADGAALSSGQEGEIRISGPSVFDGYLDPREPSAFDLQGRLCTGDIGFFDAEGELVVKGRARLTVWTHGRILCAEELETAALDEPGVSDAAAVPLGDAFGLLLVAVEESDALQARVLEGLAARLPAFGRPRRIRFVGEIPRRPTGKIDREAAARQLTQP